MPYEEFIKWREYLELQPLGWRDDDRTLKLLQIQGFKGEPSSIFSSLAIMKGAINKADGLGLNGSAMLSFIKGAKGGDSLFGGSDVEV